MKSILLILVYMCTMYCYSTAQTELWTMNVEEKAYYKQLEDGKIFLKSGKNISLIDNVTGEKLWHADIAASEDPSFFENLPIMYFSGESFAIIDATDGKVIEKGDQKTEILDIHYYWDQGRIVLELNQNDKHNVYNLNLHDLDASWLTEIGVIKKTLFGLVTKNLENDPIMLDDGTFILDNKKNVVEISKEGIVDHQYDFKDKVEVLGVNADQNVIFVKEDKKVLHFIDLTKNEITKTIKLDKFDLSVIDDGNTVAVSQKKQTLFFDATSGEEKHKAKFGKKILKSYYDNVSNKYLTILSKSIVEHDQKTGKELQRLESKDKYISAYRQADKLIVYGYSDFNELETNDKLSLKYKKPIRAENPKITDYKNIKDVTIYSNNEISGYYYAVDDEGTLLWNKRYDKPTQYEIIDDGILIISDAGVMYFNIIDGKRVWKDKLDVDPSFTYVYDDINDRFIFYSKKRLYTFDPKDKIIKKSKEKFHFKDFDYDAQQPQIVPQEKSILLKGSNSVYVTNKYTEKQHEKHYKRTNTTSTLLKIATTAVQIGGIASGNLDKVANVYSGGELVHKGSMVDGLNSSWGYSEKIRMKRQALQNKSSNAYPFVFTKLGNKKKGLIFIDPSTGEEKHRIEIDKKGLDYVLDEIDGVLYYKKDGKLSAVNIK